MTNSKWARLAALSTGRQVSSCLYLARARLAAHKHMLVKVSVHVQGPLQAIQAIDKCTLTSASGIDKRCKKAGAFKNLAPTHGVWQAVTESLEMTNVAAAC